MFDAARRNLLQRRTLEFTQDVVCGLCLLVFVVGEVVFILLLPELFRLLLLYLGEHRVSVATMVEVGIVGTLCEVILRSALHIDWPPLLVVFVFALTLGVVLRFSGIRLYAKGGKPGEEHTTLLGACHFRPTPVPNRGIRAKQI